MKITLQQAVKLLAAGGVVAVPTETVYGLAARADNPEAISRIYAIKNRPADNPLICHFHSVAQIRKYAAALSPLTLLLLHKFSPGPISFLIELKPGSPLRRASAGRKYMVARIPLHPMLLKLLRELDAPLAAPSANTSGRVSTTTAMMVQKDLGSRIDGVLDGGPSVIGLESTIVDARKDGAVKILRPGVVGIYEIQHLLKGKKAAVSYQVSGSNTPGTRYRHYAPETPLYRISKERQLKDESHCVLLCTSEDLDAMSPATKSAFAGKGVIVLSLGSVHQLSRVARNLFFTLTRIDEMKVRKAYYLENDWGSSSLGVAIRNRLEKACG